MSVTTFEYSPGLGVDAYGEHTAPTVLLWHGLQRHSRAALGPLAEALAARGLQVVVPDWDARAEDRGRSALLASVEFAQRRAAEPAGLVVVGWSMGGAAATGLTLGADRLGVPVAHTVTLAGAFMADDPFTGIALDDVLRSSSAARTPFTLLHGVADDVVPTETSRVFAEQLEACGRRAEYVELAADHGSIAGARFDPSADRYDPSDDPRTLAVADDVASRIATAAGR